MRYLILTSLVLILITSIAHAQTHELRMSIDDTFIVSDDVSKNVHIEKLLTLRFADVLVTPKEGQDFSLMLYFKADTPDLAQFDTAHKMQRAIQDSTRQYLPYIIEKEILLKKMPTNKWYGFYTIMTDVTLANTPNPPDGEFKYMVRGMLRVSRDSALGFSLMINEINTTQYTELFKYILSFQKHS